MNFEGQYLSYVEYKALGGSLDLTPFNLLEYNARKKIDERTFGRLINLEVIPQEVKLCVYALINTLDGYVNKNVENKGISSESTDGYSVSYNTPNKAINEAINGELDANINTYLANVVIDNTPVLFRGAKC